MTRTRDQDAEDRQVLAEVDAANKAMSRDFAAYRRELLNNFETFELVNELLRRGWETTTRVRNWKRPRRVLLEPRMAVRR